MHKCKECGRPLTITDVGATKKLINRGAEEFRCISCLARHFEVEEALIFQKIKEWHQQGCELFPEDPTNTCDKF